MKTIFGFDMNLYLLTIRSSQETAMFATRADYQYCLHRLSKLKHDYQLDIRGFCLMPDYLKLVLDFNTSEINKELVVLCPNDQLVVWKNIKKILPKSRLLKGQCVRIADRRRLEDVLKYMECEPVWAGIVSSSEKYRFCSAYHR
jgi:REP element-mobilizing transposase RayT